MGVLWIRAAATGLGSGLSPVAPGTVGTIAAIPLYLLFSLLAPPLYVLSTVAFIFLAVYVAGAAEAMFGEPDSPRIVIDEMAGFLVVMTFIPPSPSTIAAGFFLFRFFDILKPFPVGFIERRFSGGYGIVGDDVMAGIYGACVLHVVMRLI